MSDGAAISRRAFLLGARDDWARICPPGVALSDLAACSDCGKCVDACPTGIITMQNRLPALDFSVGECTFCGKCAQICPEPVFSKGVVERFDHIVTIGDDCLSLRQVDCQACRDSCAAQAIRVRPRIGGPFIPSVDEDICTGCGGCISVCPVDVIQIKETPTEAQYV